MADLEELENKAHQTYKFLEVIKNCTEAARAMERGEKERAISNLRSVEDTLEEISIDLEAMEF